MAYINNYQWDGGVINHNNALSAAALVANFKAANREVSMARYYFDAMLRYYNIGEGNIDITGKSKIIIIYSNMGSVSALNVGLGTVNVTEGDSWKTDHMEIGNSGGMLRNLSIKKNMQKGEWAALEIDLAQFKTLSDGTDGKAINVIGIQQDYHEAAGIITVSSDTVYIRAIIVL